MFLFFLTPFVFAQDVLTQRAQGNFRCAEGASVRKQKKEEALKKTLAATSLLIRPLASSALKNKPRLCERYQISTEGTKMNIQCDDQPRITLMLDGTPTSYPTKRGTISVVAAVNENHITQTFQGKKGGLTVEYIFEDKRLRVIKTIASSYLGTPLVVEMDYIPEAKQ